MTESSEKQGIPILVWILGGCGGCAILGLFGVGIIAAIALPAFLNTANKAKEAEAKTYVGSMARAEQAYFLEKGKLTTSIPDLGIGISPETANYHYSLVLNPSTPNRVLITAVPKQVGLRSVAGAVFAIKTGNDSTTLTQVCQSEAPSQTPPTKISVPGNSSATIDCPAGSRSIH